MSLSLDITHQMGDFALDVAFETPNGITALFGRSGAGKTSVVNALAGVLRPTTGQICLAGQVLFDAEQGINLPVHKRRLGYVFQDGRLFPHMNVVQNLTYGQRFAPRDAIGPELEEVSDLLGLTDLHNRRPGDLSGGEKQRVAFGRALLSRPRMLLMDEPLAALDEARKEDILPYLERLRDHTDIPILYVSHSVSEVARLASSVVVLEQGRVVQSGPADQVFSNPDMVRQFGVREAGSVLSGRLVKHHSDGLSELAVSGGILYLPQVSIDLGATTRVRVLAKDVMIALDRPQNVSALNILAGKIVAVRDGAGPGVIVQIACGSDFILARITRRSTETLSLAPGARVYAVIKSVSVARGDIGAA